MNCCSVEGCFTSTANSNIKLFRFPKDMTRNKLWVEFSGNPRLMDGRNQPVNAYMCSKHFESNQFRRDDKQSLGYKAVPTISVGSPLIPVSKPPEPPDCPNEPLASHNFPHLGPAVFLDEDTVRDLLTWDTLVPIIEGAMRAASDKKTVSVVQPPRTIMPVPTTDGFLMTMPGFSGGDNALACKVVTAFPKNSDKGLATINATILLFDPTTGRLAMIMEANEVTAWRTAAASVVATKHLSSDTNILAILGSGIQAKSHALAMDNSFNFNQIRVWSRNLSSAQSMCEFLREYGTEVVAYESGEECVKDADVIVTATYATSPILRRAWVKPGVHINAIGAGVNHHSELDEHLYRHSVIYTDTMASAKVELQGLAEFGVKIEGEIGDIVAGQITPNRQDITVFHSLGMAVEDAVTAKLVYDKYRSNQQSEDLPEAQT
uniref:Ketimine reductase mu-crystallin n=2 Tax=Timema TaxID=61471 RepID=A0A7R9NWB3_9NEOP|nr:unnamed protein product [Timema bartmani]CAD7458610.1 unnamed protein product [Timema tahoe]